MAYNAMTYGRWLSLWAVVGYACSNGAPASPNTSPGGTSGREGSSDSGSAGGGSQNTGGASQGGSNAGGASQEGGSAGAGGSTGGAMGEAGMGLGGGSAGGGMLHDSGPANDASSARGDASSSAAETGAGDTGGADPFVLSWQDDFNTLDTSSWQLQSFTFAGNLALFSTQNVSVANGILTMHLTSAPAGSAQPYLGVEMRSTRTLTYGKLSARMRFATGSGVVSGLVLFYTPFPNCNWNEIDIEHLGNSSNTSQLNAMVFLGTPVPNCTTSVAPTQDPLITNLGFNAETDSHLYDVEWTPAGVRYLADGVLLRTWTNNIERLTLPQTILLTIWASSAAGWAGPILPNSAPTTADVDWVKVYRWNP